MIEYVVLGHTSTVVLGKAVSNASKDRWRPQGGISFDRNGIAHQAMIRTKCHHTSRNDRTCMWCGDTIDGFVNKE